MTPEEREAREGCEHDARRIARLVEQAEELCGDLEAHITECDYLSDTATNIDELTYLETRSDRLVAALHRADKRLARRERMTP